MLPTNMTMLEGQGAIVAHGTLDFEVDSDTLDFIAAGYFENAINGRQLSTTGSVNLGQSTTATRSFNLINALPTSVLSGGEGANTSLSAHMLTGAAGSTGVSDSLVEVSGNNRYSQKEAAYLSDDGASFVVQESDYIVGSGLLEWNLISLINNDIRRQEDSGSSVFSAIEVEADDGAILTGAAAMEYLEAHSDPNAGWLFDPDRVNIEMTTENGDTWRDFTARVATDARAYLNNTTERYADLSTYAPGQAFAYMLNNVFGTGGVTPNNQLQLLEYANNADAVQVDAVAQGQSLARSAAGFLQIAPFLHEQSDQNVPYPVRIRIFARQEEPETHVVPQYPEVPVDAISGP